VTPPIAKFGIGWSLRLTNEGAYILRWWPVRIANAPRFAEAIRDAVVNQLFPASI
jgi:hypothetical protein